MYKKLNINDFIKKSKDVHGDKYDYSLVNYINSKTKVKIICYIHGEFIQTPSEHMRGQGCKKCRINFRKIDKNYIKKLKNIHGDKYDYSLSEYKGNKIKIKIICPVHGIFEQIPLNHLHGSICPKCNLDNKINALGNHIFIKKSNKIHNNKYDYSLVNYINNKTKVKIKCPLHGIFEQTPEVHLRGNGCRECSNILLNNKFKKSNDDFIKKSNETHDNKYDYSLVNYINSKTKVKIKCPLHGEFKQNPFHHINGHGCPICNESKGEKEIRILLKNKNIKFYTQKTFIQCKNKRLLKFDFYLPDYNMCIEYDGKQHYKMNDFFGGEKEFKELQKRDNIKTKYCKENKINLIRIKYNDNINEKLNNLIKKQKINYVNDKFE